MKIVTYNVNGLRPRIAQFGSLLKLLNSLDADIICFQETKLSRQELTADLVMADGYESFFSCTRTTGQGRVGYSGVATFCRVKLAFASNEVALPLSAEEGFTGLLGNSRALGVKKEEMPAIAVGLEEFAKEELFMVDNEGRCIITDHGHFVLFNIYGPRAGSDDSERIQFKLTFFKILQKRWEFLLHQGRRIIIVGDLNIAPSAIDKCEANPDFEKNEFRRWLRSMLVEHGGHFYDVFRANHPERREAYTCWPQNTGAEEFNYGSRIDHILISKTCLHQEHGMQDHNFMTCHVKECDILMQFHRWKPGVTPRWKGGRSIKLDGSDHVPVYTSLFDIPDIQEHNTPSLSSRYAPMVRGIQQKIASLLIKRRNGASSSFSDESNMTESCDNVKSTFQNCSVEFEGVVSTTDEYPKRGGTSTKKKPRQHQWSQLSLKSFFQKSSNVSDGVDNLGTDVSHSQADGPKSNCNSYETPIGDDDESGSQCELNTRELSHDEGEQDVCGCPENEKNTSALLEWQRIQQLMQNSIPLCKGHKEPCVARIVKKAGPNYGRRFYVCSRPEGPASNPETNCDYFKWAASKSKHK